MSRLGGHNAANRRDPLEELIPSTAIAMWHSEIACSPTAWVDQIGGRSLTGVGTPVVSADGAFFNGRTVAQAAITGSKTWLATFSALAVIGSRPWLYAVGRSRTLDATSRHLVATNGVNGLRARTTGFRSLWNSAGSNDSAGAADTNPHILSTWLDGTNINLRVDASTVSAAFGAAITADMVSIAVGQDTAGGAISDASVAFYLIASSKPSTAEILALDTWAKSYWGVP